MSLRSWPEQCKPLEDLERAGQVSEPARLGAAPTPELDSEKAFQAAVEKELRARGWKVYHTRDSRKSEKGFPDIIAVRAGYMIVAELKVGDNKPTADQATWLELFEELAEACNARVLVFLWYPTDWADITAFAANPAWGEMLR